MEGPERNMGDIMSLMKSGIHESCQKVQKKGGGEKESAAYSLLIHDFEENACLILRFGEAG